LGTVDRECSEKKTRKEKRKKKTTETETMANLTPNDRDAKMRTTRTDVIQYIS